MVVVAVKPLLLLLMVLLLLVAVRPFFALLPLFLISE